MDIVRLFSQELFFQKYRSYRPNLSSRLRFRIEALIVLALGAFGSKFRAADALQIRWFTRERLSAAWWRKHSRDHSTRPRWRSDSLMMTD
jgi:hypothetical protein